jgi:hypothetical protein
LVNEMRDAGASGIEWVYMGTLILDSVIGYK